jgi:hypothetical protein
MAKAKRLAEAVQPLPFSWELKDWEQQAPHVWPHTAERAKWLVKNHRADLIKYGVLSRIGHLLIISGSGYANFLQAMQGRVEGYVLPMNRAEHAHKRHQLGAADSE